MSYSAINFVHKPASYVQHSLMEYMTVLYNRGSQKLRRFANVFTVEKQQPSLEMIFVHCQRISLRRVCSPFPYPGKKRKYFAGLMGNKNFTNADGRLTRWLRGSIDSIDICNKINIFIHGCWRWPGFLAQIWASEKLSLETNGTCSNVKQSGSLFLIPLLT